MSIKYINLIIFSVNAILSLYFALKDGKGWWSAFMGWTVATISQLEIIILNNEMP